MTDEEHFAVAVPDTRLFHGSLAITTPFATNSITRHRLARRREVENAFWFGSLTGGDRDDNSALTAALAVAELDARLKSTTVA